MKNPIEVNDVVQINPDELSGIASEYAGLFAVIKEIHPSHILAHIPSVQDNITENLTILDLLHTQYKRIGQAAWIANEEESDAEVYSTNNSISPSSDDTA